MLPAVGSLRLHILHTQRREGGRRRWFSRGYQQGCNVSSWRYHRFGDSLQRSNRTFENRELEQREHRVRGGLGALLGVEREVN